MRDRFNTILMNQTTSSNYRHEIDGLRAVAVLAVLAYHAFPDLVSSGYLGVDTFFVISGFVITRSLLSQNEITITSLGIFYEKRIRRIYPPLLVTCVMALFIGITFSPADFKNVGQSLVAAPLMLGNYFFYLETDYFNPFNQVSPLLHTWSLGVEEQFYLLFPLILLAAGLHLKRLTALLWFIGILSFYAAQSIVDNNSNLAFYSIHSRAWQLLAGALVAVLESYCLPGTAGKPSYRWASVAPKMTAGLLVMLIFMLVLPSKQFAHPSWYALAVTLVTLGVIATSAKMGVANRILRTAPMQQVGKLSYGIYLYHFPVFSAIAYHYPGEKVGLAKLMALPGILIISRLSFDWIERPARDRTVISTKAILAFTLVAVTLLVVIGLLVHVKGGFQELQSRRLAESGGVLLVDVPREQSLLADIRDDLDQRIASEKALCLDHGRCQNLLIVGDSFAEDTYYAMASVERFDRSISLMKLDDTCMSSALFSSISVTCMNRELPIAPLLSADLIIISAKWQESTIGPAVNFVQALAEHTRAKIYVVGSALFEDLSSFSFKTKNLNNDQDKISELAYRNQRFDRLRISRNFSIALANNDRIGWIERQAFFCDDKLPRCNLFYNGLPLIWDNAHLTARAYPLFGRYMHDSITRLVEE